MCVFVCVIVVVNKDTHTHTPEVGVMDHLPRRHPRCRVAQGHRHILIVAMTLEILVVVVLVVVVVVREVVAEEFAIIIVGGCRWWCWRWW